MEATFSTTTNAWQDGEFLVLRRDSPIAPDRCIFTNQAVFEMSKVTRRLSWGSEGPKGSWSPASVRLLSAATTMKFIEVTFGVSGERMALRLLGMALAVVMIAVGAAMLVHGLSQGVPPPMIYAGGGAALIVVAITLLANTWSILSVVDMTDNHVWLRGARKPFLDSLPRFSDHATADPLSELPPSLRGSS